MNERQFVCAAKVIGYANLMIQCRNINGTAKRKILDAVRDMFCALNNMNEDQMQSVEMKFSQIATQVMGADGLDAEEIAELKEVGAVIESLGAPSNEPASIEV